ncbi:MAG: radical SAM protein [Candidatus Aminicenantes bacterium]|nr:radical SAM protein [Candidatus Aminicenantes bacterium]
MHVIEFESLRGNKYIYDISTNTIWPYPPIFQKILYLYPSRSKEAIVRLLSDKYDIDDLNNFYDLADNLIRKYKAFFVNPGEIKNIASFDLSIEEFENSIANIKHLILEVTEKCNLRCSYCLYSGKYDSYRTHGGRSMDFNTAKRALDYFLGIVKSEKRTRKFGTIHINFYGGEPLLNFPLIKKCVDYIEAERRNKIRDRILYSITTNGTLLNEETIDYIMDHKFALAISLDGPREEHDKNRRFPDGRGSFEIVYNNLLRVLERNPEYSRNITLTLTYSYNHDLRKIAEFFMKYIPFENINFRISPVRDENLLPLIPKRFLNSYREILKEYQIFLSRGKKDKKYHFLSSFFKNIYKPLYDKHFFTGIKRSYYSSVCKIENFRLFVSVDGLLHICERINNHFSIGDVEKGIIYQKVKKIYDAYYKQVVAHCPLCPAINVCSVCPSFVGAKGHFISDQYCKRERRKLKDMLITYVSLNETNNNLLFY